MAKRISISDLKTFIRQNLPGKLRKDLLAFHIIREADIACCVYFHLRKFLQSDRTWRVFAERYSEVTGHIIDIVIFREGSKGYDKCQNPRIALELKWNWSRISRKDRASLDKCIKLLGLEKVYFISLYTKENKQTIKKTKHEKFRLFEIYIPLGLEGEALMKWKAERRLFAKMSLGKRGSV